ncbi:beta-ketoacyl synthase N-terminal-like domain-containing protein [Paenibacillus sp. SI8]|uniref:beta-ketoacyl synthase N-terminal-like domain-containing protein n=1 Tax=unclassified Paenibacillus TaxID=185978 RepID=UPI003466A119
MQEDTLWEQGVAVIGMSGRFPGAPDLESFWNLLSQGRHGVRFFPDEELRKNGLPEDELSHPSYVKAKGVLEEPELFDAAFFGMSPREAEWTDPQQRLFLECSYEALETAGWVPDTYKGRIGVYGGCTISTYLLNQIALHQSYHRMDDAASLILGNDKDFLTSRVAYKLNLKGPAVTVQTACSTSLVAVHLACQSLLSGECDIALAGGSTVSFPNYTGYRFRDGMIMSPDGFCRTFDSEAQGTVPGNGVGVVALKRLEQAAADGDHVYAVIRGSAINNDGGLKAGFTAPSPEGQAEVIADALAVASVHPDTISYVEAHGTATIVGDPIEIAGLTRAFRQWTDRSGYCAIGSVKSSIGHLDSAAGVAGLIKTVLALYHRQLPPSLHYRVANPQIDFANSPFYVQTELSDWPADSQPRRAGVSSFGIGATNAHVVLEEAPSMKRDIAIRPWHALLVSGKTEKALDAACERLAEQLSSHLPQPEALEEIAYTTQVGRKGYAFRRTFVCRDAAEAVHLLTSKTARWPESEAEVHPPTAWLLLALKEDNLEGLLELSRTEPIFRKIWLETLSKAESIGDVGLSELLFALASDKPDYRPLTLDRRSMAVVSLAASYSLALTLSQLGLQPDFISGEGEGEYAAACMAGICSLKEAFQLVVDPRGHHEISATSTHDSASGAIRLAHPLTAYLNRKLTDSPQSPSILRNNGVDWQLIELQNALQNPGIRAIAIGSPLNLDVPRNKAVLSCFNSHTWTNTLAALWEDGAEIDWQARYLLEKRRRVPLPTYPFERQYYGLEHQRLETASQISASPLETALRPTSGVSTPICDLEDEDPRLTLERRLIQFHVEVLGLAQEEIRIDIPFYELGADSLSMIRIISRIQETYPILLNVKGLYESQTISELADSIELSFLELLEQDEAKG